MSGDPQNQQYGTGASLFGQDAGPYASTGAPGTQGTTVGDELPDTAYHTQVTMPYQSVQNVPVPMVGVGADDTGVSSQSQSYGPAADPLTGIGSELGQTGAGAGHAGQVEHPNSTAPAMTADPYVGKGDEGVAAALNARGPSDGYVRPEEMQAFLANAKAETIAAAVVQVAEVTRPGGPPDALERESFYRAERMHQIGRPLSDAELMGAPALDCVACARMAGRPCAEHTRKLGDPIPLPPRPWPSEQPGRYPGAIHLPPYNIAELGEVGHEQTAPRTWG